MYSHGINVCKPVCTPFFRHGSDGIVVAMAAVEINNVDILLAIPWQANICSENVNNVIHVWFV